MNDKLKPVCQNRQCPSYQQADRLIAVTDVRTSLTALSSEHDTPVWWCPDCHYKVERQEHTTYDHAERS